MRATQQIASAPRNRGFDQYDSGIRGLDGDGNLDLIYGSTIQTSFGEFIRTRHAIGYETTRFASLRGNTAVSGRVARTRLG